MRHVRTRIDRKSTYMGLIDHRPGGGMLRGRVQLPVEMVISEDAFGRSAGVIDGRNAQVAQAAGRVVATGGQEIPIFDASNCSCKWIQQQLVRVESVAFFRFIWSFDAVAVQLARGNASQPNVPNIASAMARRIQMNRLAGRRIVSRVVELQVNTGRVSAEQNKINSVSLLMRTADGQWISHLNITFFKGRFQYFGFVLFESQFSHRTLVRASW